MMPLVPLSPHNYDPFVEAVPFSPEPDFQDGVAAVAVLLLTANDPQDGPRLMQDYFERIGMDPRTQCWRDFIRCMSGINNYCVFIGMSQEGGTIEAMNSLRRVTRGPKSLICFQCGFALWHKAFLTDQWTPAELTMIDQIATVMQLPDQPDADASTGEM